MPRKIRKKAKTVPPVSAIKAAPITGGKDGSDVSFRNPQNSPEDPIVAEHGDYFIIKDDGTVEINEVAVDAKFATEYHVFYDGLIDSFRQYAPDTGHFPPIKEAALKWPLAEFLMKLAKASAAEAFISKRTNSRLSALINLLKGWTAAAKTTFSTRNLIHVGNGMLDLSGEEPKLLSFDPRYRSTRFCPFRYNPAARCDRFLAELLQPAVSQENIDLLRRYFGAALFGSNQAQRLLIAHGSAAAGKSTLVKILETIIGHENVAHLRTEHLGGRFETHSYLGKTLLAGKDVPGDFLSQRGAKMLKALVGDDQHEAERKFAGKHQFNGDFNVLVTSNCRLRFTFEQEEDEEAWRRRLLVIEFVRPKIERRIPNFADELLREEGEGILAWAISGAVDHRKELAEGGDYKLTPSQTDHINALIAESSSADAFVRGQIQKHAGAQVTVQELEEAYFRFCEARGWRPFSARQFEHVLSPLMLKVYHAHKRTDLKRDTHWARGFKNVALVKEAREQ